MSPCKQGRQKQEPTADVPCAHLPPVVPRDTERREGFFIGRGAVVQNPTEITGLCFDPFTHGDSHVKVDKFQDGD